MQGKSSAAAFVRLALGASPRERVGAVWRANGVLAFFLGLELLCAPALAVAQAIRTDGRTQTTVTTTGAVTDVRTGTVRNGNAFNSFSTFSVPGATVTNLHLPNGVSNLVNLVRDERTNIDGILNAIKDGRIGGNVWFANPHGFVVGPSGVVNVGSLSVSTPSRQFVDSFFLAPGSPDDAAVAQLLNGTAPRSGTGLIRIDGQVNAIDGVSLSAGTISVGGSIFSGARFVGSAPDFRDVVNVNGLASANNVIAREGRIEIVADGDVTVSGTLAAPGAPGVRGGDISIRAGGSVDLQPGANLVARGNGESSAGGTVYVWGDKDATFRAGATIDASAGATGNGGAIELSAKNNVELAGGQFNAGATAGTPGSVLIDPATLVISSNLTPNDGASYSGSATDSITVNSNVVISTRKISAADQTAGNYDTGASTGNSGNITLTAPLITLNSGSKLYAHATTGFTAGDITLTATKLDHMAGFRAVDATTKIDISGATLKGKNISVTAYSEAGYDWAGNPAEVATRAITDAVFGTLFFGLTGLNIGIAISNAKSEVFVRSGSNLDAQGDGTTRGTVTLRADSSSKAEHLKIGIDALTNISGQKLFNAGFVWGQADSTATVDIASGATVKARDLSVAATNNATTDANVIGISKDTSLNAAAVVNKANVQSSATVASGATIDVNNNVTVQAINQNRFSSSATAMAFGSGSVGIAFNYTELSTGATATMGANLTTAGLANVKVEALNDTVKNKSAAGTAAGSSVLAAYLVEPLLSAADGMVNRLIGKSESGNQQMDDSTGAGKPKIGAALTYADNVHNASASIGGGATVTASGDVVVAAKVNDQRIRTHATASVDGKKDDPHNPGVSLGLSGAVSLGFFDHNVSATIGDGAKVTASHVGVVSELTMPYEITWAKWEGANTIFSKINSNLGLGDGLLSGWSNATVSGCVGTCLAGSVTFLDFDNSSLASVGRSAEIKITPGGNNAWSTTLTGDSTAFVGTNNTTIPATRTINFDSPVHVKASSDVQGVYVAGNMGLLINGAGGEPGASAAGGAYNQVEYTSVTKAWVSEGALIQQTSGSPVNVTVQADGKTQITAVTPSAGSGGSYGANIIFAMAKVNDTTEASIDNEARVTGGNVVLKAEANEIVWSLSGALNKSEAAGVGAGVAFNNVTTNTRAAVADNDANNAGGSTLSLTNGKVTADQLQINARTDGRIESIAIAGAAASSSDPNEPGGGLLDSVKSGLSSLLSKIPVLGSKLSGGSNPTPGDTGPGAPFGIAVAGSSAVNTTSLGTRAYIEDSTVQLSNSGTNPVSVSAVTDTDITAATGSIALVRANSPSSSGSVGIAGSIAVNKISNNTEAWIKNSSVTEVEDVSVTALAGGEQLAVALGMAVNATADQSRAGSFAGSVSVSMTDNTTSAKIENSTITGVSTGPGRDLQVVAYDRIKLGTGGGSLIAGGKGGVGAAVTYSQISNTTEAAIDGSSVTNFDSAKINALTASKIGAGAGMAGGTWADNGVSIGGGFVVSQIDNTVKAEIRGSGVSTASSVEVKAADSTGVAALNTVIDAKDGGNANASSLDYDGTGSGLTAGAGSSVVSVAGVLQLGSSNVGMSFAYNKITNDFTAGIRDSNVSASNTGTVDVLAQSNATMTGVAVGVGVATSKFAGSGSLTLSEINNNTTAEITSTDPSKKVTADILTVKAEDKSQSFSFAGNVTLSAGNAAIGAAVGVSSIGNTTRAKIEGADIDAKTTTTVNAKNDSDIKTYAASVGGALGSGVSLNGSAAASNIANTTEAKIVSAKADDSTNSITVKAEDSSDIRSLAGGVAVQLGAGGGAGAGIAVNTITNTTRAAVEGTASGGKYSVKDLQVKADSDATIDTIAVGVGGGVQVGVGASVAVNKMANTTDAHISAGADVEAENNVGVIAETDDKLKVLAGSGGIGLAVAGVGASVTVNKLEGTTQAYIDGATTKVSARAKDPAQTMSVASGALSSPVDLSSSLGLATYNAGNYDLASKRATTAVLGLAVNATATHYTATQARNIAGGTYAGVAGTTAVSLIGGETKAYINAARINGGDNSAASAGQAVNVSASDHAYGTTFIGSLSVGTAGVGVAVDTNIFDRDIKAYVTSTVDAKGNATIKANSTQGVSSLVVGAGGGAVGVVGTGSVAKFTSETEAYTSGATLNVGSANVAADHDSRMFVAGGTAVVGGIGVTGTFAVALDQSVTKAHLDSTTVTTSGAVSVLADSSTEVHNWGISGAAGGAAAVAGAVTVAIIDNDTKAYVTGSSIGTGGARAGSLTVSAIDTVSTEAKAGAGAGSLVGGGGASVAVTKIDNTASSYVENSNVYTTGDISITSTASRDLSSFSVAVGAGLTAGVSGSVGVVVVGSDIAASPDASSELGSGSSGSQGSLQTFANGNRFDSSNVSTTSDFTAADVSNLNARAATNTNSAIGAGALDQKTSARIFGGSSNTVSAGANLTVSATEKDKIDLQSGSVAAGAIGLGASVAVSRVTNNVEAKVQGQVTAEAAAVSAGQLTVSAETVRKDASSTAVLVRSWQGSGGVLGAAGAAVATNTVTNNVTAALDRGTTTKVTSGAGELRVTATDSQDLDTQARGYTVGAVAAGAVVSRSNKGGTVSATVSDTATSGSGTTLDPNTSQALLSATRTGTVNAFTQAGAGGVISGSGSDAQATDSGTVTALIGGNAIVRGGPVSVQAVYEPRVTATAEGYGGALYYGVGVSIATATANPTVSANIGGNVDLDASQLDVGAAVRQNGTLANAESRAVAAGGGLLVGVNATLSTAQSTSNVSAGIATGTDLAVSGNLTVSSSNSTKEKATASGITGGFVAAGATTSNATSNSTTTTTVANGVTGYNNGTQTITAAGSDDTYSETFSGSGGVVAGAAALANTRNLSNTTATLGGGNGSGYLTAGSTILKAEHTATFNSKVDSINAAVLGASGAVANHDTDSTVTAQVGDGAKIRTQALDVLAKNVTRKPWLDSNGFNAQAGAGGVFSGAATVSSSTIDNVTRAKIGGGSATTVDVTGDRANPGITQVQSLNDVEARDRTKLDVGGAIAVARAESVIQNNNTAETTLSNNAQLFTVGAPDLTARTRADVETSANAKTYGLAGAAEGKSDTYVRASNTVTVGTGARIRADGDINLAAGEDASAAANDLKATARTDLFNKTAIPIPPLNSRADARISQTNGVVVNGAVDSVGDIYLTANKGSAVASGSGTGKDLYRQILAEIGSAISSLFGGGDVSLDVKFGTSNSTTAGDSSGVTVNSGGTVSAGIQNKMRLTIGGTNGAAGQDDVYTPLEGVTVSFTDENIVTNMLNDITRLVNLKGQYQGDSVAQAAFEAEIQRIRSELVQQGFATPEGIPLVNIQSRFATVSEIKARGGDVNIKGDFLAGGGTVRAPNDTEITVTNQGANSLRVGKLTIEDRGGKVKYNGADLAAAPAGFAGTIVSAASGGTTPVITVQSTFNPFPNRLDEREPDIQITNDVSNNATNGRIEIHNLKGSVLIQGVGSNPGPKISATTINMSAGKNITQAFINGFSHVGGDPKLIWSGVANSFEGPNTGGTSPGGVASGTNNSNLVGFGSTIAGNNVFLSAAYLNINGTVQSGVPDRAVNLDKNRAGYVVGQTPVYQDVPQPDPYAYEREQLQFYQALNSSFGVSIPTELQNLPPPPPPLRVLVRYDPVFGNLGQWLDFQKTQWEANGRPANTKITIPNLGANIAAAYNPGTQRIELENVVVEGGNVELFGRIFNTGGGNIKVMDGYGRIGVANDTGIPLQLNSMNTGNNGIAGKIRITDILRQENGLPVTSEITRVNGQVRVDEYNGTTFLRTNYYTNAATESRSGAYSYGNPLSGLRYVWQTGQDYSTKFVGTAFSDQAIGFIPSGSGSYNSIVSTPQSAFPLGIGDYLRVSPNANNYTYGFANVTTSTTTPTRREWSECIRTIIWCVERRYWVEDTWYQGTKRIHTHSIKADYAIPVQFIGYNTGQIDVSSDAGIYLNNSLTNRGGTTNLWSSAGSIAAETTRPLSTLNADLRSATGVGAAGAPLNLDMRGGTVSATATSSGDIVMKNVNATSELRIGSVNAANGNVNLESGGNIVAADAGTQTRVTGRRIDLLSTGGAIGTAAQALVVQSDAGVGNGVGARAAGDINLTQASGDFRIDKIESITGDVKLTATSGSIVDGNPEEQRDTRTETALLGLWNDMLLTGANADQSLANQVNAIKRQRETDYRTYWGLRNVQPVRDSNGNITGYTADAYNAGYVYTPTASEIASLTPAQLTTYVNARTAAYHDTHTRLGAPAGAVSTPQANLYLNNYSYTLSQAEVDNLSQNGSYKWTDNELKFAVSRNVFFKQTTDTETRIETPNVKGRNITLNALAGGIGKNNGEEVITRGATTLTTDQRVALAAAEADDVSVEPSVIRVFKRDDVDVQATGTISINARNNVFLGSQTDLNVQTVTTGDNIRIKGDGNIFNVQTSGPAITQTSGTGHAVILESSAGKIGTAIKPLTMTLQPDATVTARSSTGVWLDTTAGDLPVAEIFSTGDIGLGAAGSILDVRGARPQAIQGVNVALNPRGGSVGTFANPFYVVVNGALTGSTPAGQSFNVTIPGNFDVGGINSGGGARLEAANGNMTMNSLTAAGNVTLIASGSILNARTDSLATLTAVDGNFTATNGSIGTALKPLAVNLTGNLTSSAKTGTYIDDTTGNLSVTSATTSAGDTTLRALAGSLTVASASANGSLTVHGNTGITATSLTTTNGSITGTANTGDLSLTTTDAANAVSLTATAGNIKVDTVEGQNGVTLSAGGSILGKTAARTVRVESLGGDVSMTAGTAGGTGSITANLTRASGNLTMAGRTGVDATTTTATNGTMGMSSSNGALALGTANSEGQMTLSGQTGITATSLTTDTGSLNATTTTGDLTATTVDSANAATLAASAGNVKVDTVEAQNALAITAGSSVLGRSASRIARIESLGGDVSVTAQSGSITSDVTRGAGNVAMSAGTTIDATTTRATGGTLGMTTVNGTMTLDSARSGGTMTLDSMQALTANTLTTDAGTLNATARTQDLAVTTTASTAGAANLTATTGNVKVDTVDAQNDISVTAGQSIGGRAAARYVRIESTAGNVTLNAQSGTITSNLTRGAGNVTMNAGTGIDATTTTATNGNLGMTASTGDLTSVTASAGTDASLVATAGNANLTTTTAGRDMTISAGSDVNSTTLTAGRNAQVAATGSISATTTRATGGTLGMSTSNGTMTLDSARSGSTMTLDSQQALTANTLTTDAGTLNATARTQDLAVTTTASTAGAANLTATTGNVKVDTVDAQNDINVTAGQSIGGRAAARYVRIESTAGNVTLNAQNGSITGDLTQAAGNAQLTAKTNLDLTTTNALNGTLTGMAQTGSILIGTANSEGQMTLSAQTGITANSLTTDTGSIAATAATGDLSLTTTDAADAVSLTASAGNIKVDTVEAQNGISASASGAIQGKTGTSYARIESLAGSLTLNAQSGDIAGDLTRASANVTLNAGNNITGGDIVSIGGNTTLTATNNITANLVSAEAGDTTLDAVNGTITAQRILGDGVLLFAKTEINGDTIEVGRKLVLVSDKVNATVLHRLRPGRTSVLEATLIGRNQPIMTSVDLTLVSPIGVVFDRFWTQNAAVNMPAGYLVLQDGYIGNRMLFNNPLTSLLMDNNGTAVQPSYDAQLYSPTRGFGLYVNANYVEATGAHIIYRDEVNHTVRTTGSTGLDSSANEASIEEITRAGRVVLPGIGVILQPTGELVRFSGSPVMMIDLEPEKPAPSTGGGKPGEQPE